MHLRRLAFASAGLLFLGLLAAGSEPLLLGIRNQLRPSGDAVGTLLLGVLFCFTLSVVLALSSFAFGILWRRFFPAIHLALPLTLSLCLPVLASLPQFRSHVWFALLLSGLILLVAFFCWGATRRVRHGITLFGFFLILASTAAVFLG